MEIKKSIIPAAGLGTRFLPYTKSIPKEMLPLLNKPAIQYIAEEGIQSGITEFLIVANEDKKSILDYFKSNPSLEKFLHEKNKLQLLASVKNIEQQAAFFYVEQAVPLGLGHAILMAQGLIGHEYFGIQLPDDIIIGAEPGLGQLIHIAQEKKASVIAVQEVPAAKVSSYGIIATKQQLNPDLFEIETLVEKPAPHAAPSRLGIIGRYVLSPRIFDALATLQPGAGGEIQLTDAINSMLQTTDEKVYAIKLKGTRHDIGTPPGWLKAINHLASLDPSFAR